MRRDRVPARPAVRRAVGRARPRGRAAPDRAVGDARPADRRHVSCRRTSDDPVGADRARARGDARRRAGRGASCATAVEGRRARRAAAAGRRRRRARRARVAAGVITAAEARRCCIAARELADAGDPRRRFRAGSRRVRDAAAGCVGAPRTQRAARSPPHEPPRARSAADPTTQASDDRADLHRRRRAHAVPQGAQPARAVRGVRPRHRRPAARCCMRQPFAPDRARRSDPRLRRAVARRSEHRPRRRAAHGLRP